MAIAEPIYSDEVLIQEDSDASSESESQHEHNHSLSDVHSDLPYYEQAVKDIKDGDLYVCMICTVEIDAKCRMYACDACYRVFDYDCVREWALKSTKKTLDKTWKCPNCYKVNHRIPAPKRNTCWCGKVVNPEANELDPNSCGQTCNAKTCMHGCSKVCHLGPHPECVIPVTITCKCGKHSKRVPCCDAGKMETAYDCGNICDLRMPCGTHRCTKVCHSGFCGPCEHVIETELPCYCGEAKKSHIKCCELEIAGLSKDGKGKEWVGVFSCGTTRTVHYACGKHSFSEVCQPSPTMDKKKPCPYSPKRLTTCPCGKTELAEMQQPRKKCSDPIPTCENVCGKPLSCGKHTCPFTCHTGDCMDPCLIIEKKPCSCESKTVLTPCQHHEAPHCTIKCESPMSCRKHRCMKVCCPGKPAAKKRDKTLFLRKDRNDETLVETEHICLKQCNQKLGCGIHLCTWKCHPGKCPPCLESDPNDLVCPCGKTIVPAPVRCGTKLPPCPNPCIKISQGPAPCGHRVGPHKCHPEGTACPPCTASVVKKCRCHKRQQLRTLCLVPDDQVTCGTRCDLVLQNCHHRCSKKCHPPGACEIQCKQICGLKRSSCEHQCKEACHGKRACPENTCHELVTITCGCNRRTKQMECGASFGNPGAVTSQKLPCDEECARLQREIELMDAFGISNNHSSTKHQLGALLTPSTTFTDLNLPYTEYVLNTYKRQTKWCTQIVILIEGFLNDSHKRSLHLKPMKAPQRQFVREIASAFSLYAESQDREPNRSVYLVKVRSDSSKPDLSLNEAAEIYQKLKEMEKMRAQEMYEAKNTKTLINLQPMVSNSPLLEIYKGPNAIMISGLSHPQSFDSLRSLINEYLKYTLIKSPQFLIKEGQAAIIVYPTNFRQISPNMAADMEKVIPFIRSSIEERLLATSVELCKIDENLRLIG